MLALQIKLKASNIIQTLEEMAVLMYELLTSDPSSAITTHACACFGKAFRVASAHICPQPLPDQPLNRIIECL
jgi:hypothetical protein